MPGTGRCVAWTSRAGLPRVHAKNWSTAFSTPPPATPGKIGEIKIDDCPGTPVEHHGALAAFVKRMFDQAFQGGETGAPGQQDHRLVRLFPQGEAAVGAVEPQDVPHLEGREDLVGEQAAGHVADVQLQKGIVVGGVGHGETAPLAILQQDVHILPGEELEAFAGRQAQVQFDDVGGQTLQFFDAGGEGLDRDVARCP